MSGRGGWPALRVSRHQRGRAHAAASARMSGELPLEDEMHCPASAEMGYLTTCSRCGVCRGADQKRNVFINFHGGPNRIAQYINQFGGAV